MNNQFTCENNICVPLSRICNGNNDCGDWSDEIRLCSSKNSFFSDQMYINTRDLHLLIHFISLPFYSLTLLNIIATADQCCNEFVISPYQLVIGRDENIVSTGRYKKRKNQLGKPDLFNEKVMYTDEFGFGSLYYNNGTWRV